MKVSYIIIFLILPFLYAASALSQTPSTKSRPPRVLEVEKMLNREAMDFLKSRFPGRPFIINVSVDPLLRLKKGSAEEGLPYYELADDEHFDEWDDPNISPTALIARVKKISMILTVPADLSEDELTEIKGSIGPSLGLLEGRDSIEIRKRTWLSTPAGDAGKLSTYHIATICLLIGFLLAGLFVVFNFTANKFGSILREVVSNKSSGNAEPISSSQNSLSLPQAEPQSTGLGSGSSDIKMLDSLEFLKHVSSGLSMLEKHKDFPRLEDMLIFEEFAQKNRAEFGAFLSEMPHDLKMRVFSYSSSLIWMQALIQPSDVGNMTLEQLQKCMRIQRNDADARWQTFLILVWRLKDKCGLFFKGMPENDAFAIMSYLPKSDGLRWAKEVFPGNWGKILDGSFQPEPLNDVAIERHSKRALEIMPYQTMDLLERHKTEVEVVKYVRTTTPQVEREIYLAAGENSKLKEIRPPFYPFFELDEEQYKTLSTKFSIDEWAVALFETSKTDRTKFESQLPPKLKSRLHEYFKKFDMKDAPSKELRAAVRDRIAFTINQEFLRGAKGSTASAPEHGKEPISGNTEAA
jgi:hypothetical protein